MTEYRTPAERLARAIRVLLLLPLFFSLFLSGCIETKPAKDTKNDKVFGEVTEDVGEGVAGEAEADMQVKPGVASPITAPLQGYGSAISTIAKQKVQQGLELYRAETGNYPKSHEEFMTQVMKRYVGPLPKLPGGRQYKYLVKERRLIVVEAQEDQD
jgi:hypothetical protein